MVSATMRVTVVALLTGLTAVWAAACGGDVVVDEKPTGANGSGGSGAGSSTGSDDDGSSDGDGSDGDTGPGPSGPGPAGPGSGPGPGSGGGGPGSCESCFTEAAAGVCAPFVDKCFGDLECQQLFTCHGDCQFDLQCMSACDAGHPGAVSLVYEAMGCVICSECLGECQGSPLQNYCLLQGGR